MLSEKITMYFLCNEFLYLLLSKTFQKYFKKIPRSRVEDPVKQRQRAETVRSKSVHELSQITSLADFPLPAPIENIIQRGPRPVERKKKFREK